MHSAMAWVDGNLNLLLIGIKTYEYQYVGIVPIGTSMWRKFGSNKARVDSGSNDFI